MEHSILLISKKNKTTPTKGSQHTVSIKVIKPDPNQGVIVNSVNPPLKPCGPTPVQAYLLIKEKSEKCIYQVYNLSMVRVRAKA